MMKVKTLIIVFLFGISYSFGQNLTVSSSVTPVAMANSLVSGCAEVIDTTVNYTGSPNAKGGFGNGQSIGLPGGIILSTGWVLSAPGPNNNNAISQS
ncbi:MAG: hypothetical protein U9R19_02445, partial [Bacteroidota bacterium]|nr:hypothetical protein [Bacteroidota bacterium]